MYKILIVTISVIFFGSCVQINDLESSDLVVIDRFLNEVESIIDTIYSFEFKIKNQHINEIAVHYSGLHHIPKYLLKLSHLDTLDLSKNDLSTIGDLSLLKKLSYLDIEENEILHFPHKKDLPNSLINLNLSFNSIKDSIYIEHLPTSMTKLMIAFNKIPHISFDSTVRNSNLRFLFLAGNQIQVLDSTFAFLPNLEQLLVDDNPIQKIDFKALQHLKYIELPEDIGMDTTYIKEQLKNVEVVFGTNYYY